MNYMAHFLRGGNLRREKQRIGKDSLLLPKIGLRNEGKKRLTVEILRGTNQQEPAGFSLDSENGGSRKQTQTYILTLNQNSISQKYV